jgi:hypothetical protein
MVIWQGSAREALRVSAGAGGQQSRFRTACRAVQPFPGALALSAEQVTRGNEKRETGNGERGLGVMRLARNSPRPCVTPTWSFRGVATTLESDGSEKAIPAMGGILAAVDGANHWRESDSGHPCCPGAHAGREIRA